MKACGKVLLRKSSGMQNIYAIILRKQKNCFGKSCNYLLLKSSILEGNIPFIILLLISILIN